MADNNKKQNREKPKLIVYKEGEYYRSVTDMQRKDAKEVKKKNN